MRTHLVVFVNFMLSALLIQASVKESEFQDAMKKMGENMKIAIQIGNELERNFSHVKPFMEPATGSHDNKVFKIQPAKNAIIRFSYSQAQGQQPSASDRFSEKRRQLPKYFLNFNFQKTVETPSRLQFSGRPLFKQGSCGIGEKTSERNAQSL